MRSLEHDIALDQAVWVGRKRLTGEYRRFHGVAIFGGHDVGRGPDAPAKPAGGRRRDIMGCERPKRSRRDGLRPY